MCRAVFCCVVSCCVVFSCLLGSSFGLSVGKVGGGGGGGSHFRKFGRFLGRKCFLISEVCSNFRSGISFQHVESKKIGSLF